MHCSVALEEGSDVLAASRVIMQRNKSCYMNSQ